MQARILICRKQKMCYNFNETYTFGLKVLQLTSFSYGSFLYLNLIIFEYVIVHVDYFDLLTFKGQGKEFELHEGAVECMVERKLQLR